MYTEYQKSPKMPCIKKKKAKPLEPEIAKIDMEKFIRDNFTLEDFLNCDFTKKILQENWYNKFTYKIESQIESFYEHERKYFREDLSTLFYYDTTGSFAGYLTAIMFEHITPEYDLDVFYENPALAKPLIEKMENSKHEKTIEHQKLIRENYKEKSTSDGQKFNWGDKNI